MKKDTFLILIYVMGCITSVSMFADDSLLNAKYVIIEKRQIKIENNLQKISEEQGENECRIENLDAESARLSISLDSLKEVCSQLEVTQVNDCKTINGKINITNRNVRESQMIVQNRTFWGVIVVVVTFLFIISVTYMLFRRLRADTSSIDNVRKAQETLQVAQAKMQEESVRLDDKLLELLDKQMAIAPHVMTDDKPDHSLALKVADEIVRIELNMSRMDSTVKGYKQLAKAVERIKDNFKANGYEIVDMLGKPYNEGMKVVANFVPDETLSEGAQIITGITKPQINYNGQMIQAAQITVSQNI